MIWRPRRAIAVVVVLAALLECSARLYCFGTQAFSYRAVNSFTTLTNTEFLRPSSNPVLQLELKPHLDSLFKLKRFTTNAHGFRDSERSLDKPPQTFRIAVVGASFVMGSGVEEPEMMHHVLETRLAETRPGVTYEVLSLAVGGYSPTQIAVLIETVAPRFHPDLVLFATSPAQYPGKDLSPGWEVLGPPPFFHVYSARLLRLGLSAIWQRLHTKPSNPAAGNAAAIQEFDQTFARLAIARHNLGVPIGIVILEHRNLLDLAPAMQRSALAHHLPVIDATVPFARAGFPSACAHLLDCHPDAWAHRVFAEAIGDGLISQHLLDRPAGSAH